jgi:ATP-dependent DNA helicase HFM1/MER3
LFQGRAGRPQFDDTAVAIIMTNIREKDKWNNLLSGKHPIESNLLMHLTEHLNSEIVLKTITNVSIAVTWLQSTFLYKVGDK